MNRHVAGCVASLWLVCVAPGCAMLTGGTFGMVGHAYTSGEVEHQFDTPVSVTAVAAAGAIADLGLTSSLSKIESKEGLILARSAEGEDIRVSLFDAEKGSVVRIRVGVFGNPDLTHRLVEAMHRRLEATKTVESVTTSADSKKPAERPMPPEKP